MVHALKWLQTAGPSDIIKAVPESYMLGDRGLYLAAFNKVRDALAVDGLMPEAGPSTALRSLALVDELVRSGQLVPALDHPQRTDRGYFLVEPNSRRNRRNNHAAAGSAPSSPSS